MSEIQTVVRVFDPEEKPRFNGHAMARRAAVPLERVPEGLEFPDGLRDHISYDSERRLLVFRGYMSSADYYFLRACSDDPEYIQALNELHEKSAFEVHCRPRIVPVWLWALVAASFLLAGLVWLCWFLGSE
jgi:hypothetical protein